MLVSDAEVRVKASLNGENEKKWNWRRMEYTSKAFEILCLSVKIGDLRSELNSVISKNRFSGKAEGGVKTRSRKICNIC